MRAPTRWGSALSRGAAKRHQQRGSSVWVLAILGCLALITMLTVLALVASTAHDNPTKESVHDHLKQQLRGADPGSAATLVETQGDNDMVIAASSVDAAPLRPDVVEIDEMATVSDKNVPDVSQHRADDRSLPRPQGYDQLVFEQKGCSVFTETGNAHAHAAGEVSVRLIAVASDSTATITEFAPRYSRHDERYFPQDSLVVSNASYRQLRLITDSLRVVATSSAVPGAGAVDVRVACDADDHGTESKLSWGYDLSQGGAASVGVAFTGTGEADRNSVGLHLTFPKKSRMALFGLPSRGAGVRLQARDEVQLKNLDVNHYALDAHANLYGSVPLVHAVDLAHPRKYTFGVLWLNAAPTRIQTKTRDGDESSVSELIFLSAAGAGRAYFLPGPTAADVLRQYFVLTGYPLLPPLFGIGYHQCRWSYRDQADVEDVNRKFDEHDIPADTIWLDIDHTNDKRYFTWDGSRFPDSLKMISRLELSGRRLVTITDPHIKVDRNYFVYRGAHDKNLFITKSARRGDEEFRGHCWPGESSWIDFANPAARAWYATLFAPEVYRGSTLRVFSWNDMNEPSVFSGPEITMPMDAGQTDGNQVYRHEDLHNMYGFHHTMATFAGHLLRSDNKQRPFVLTRSFFAGSQRYAAVWTGDNQAQWSHLKASVSMIMMHSLGGIVFVGADVGGFFDDPDEELHVRWFQLGCLYPFFRGHSHEQTRRREPWLQTPMVAQNIAEAIRFRYTLMPYLYWTFFAAHHYGKAVWRPRMLEFPFHDASYLVDEDESVMVGFSLLAVPALHKGQLSVKTTLPPVAYTNFWTGEGYAAGATVAFPVPDAHQYTSAQPVLPLLIRAGCIVPTVANVSGVRSSDIAKKAAVTLVAALDAQCTAVGYLYHDDGESTDFATSSKFCSRMVIIEFRDHHDSNTSTLHLTVRPVKNNTCAEPRPESWSFFKIQRLRVHTAHCSKMALRGGDWVSPKRWDRITFGQGVWETATSPATDVQWTENFEWHPTSEQ